MFATDSISLNNAIRTIVKTPADQGRIIAVAVAQAVAAKATLPSTELEVGSLAAYYTTNVQPMANEAIDCFGNATIFAQKTAAEYALIFWKMRYYAAHPASCPITLNSYYKSLECESAIAVYDFGTLMAGGSLLLTPELYALMNKYKAEILALTFEFVGALRLQGEGENSMGAIYG